MNLCLPLVTNLARILRDETVALFDSADHEREDLATAKEAERAMLDLVHEHPHLAQTLAGLVVEKLEILGWPAWLGGLAEES